MFNRVVVTYTIRPEARDEHVRLIEQVFEQLSSEAPTNVDYQVLCLDDGLSFVHMSTAETEDGSNPIPELSAFKEFTRDIANRLTAPPRSSDVSLVASYRGRG